MLFTDRPRGAHVPAPKPHQRGRGSDAFPRGSVRASLRLRSRARNALGWDRYNFAHVQSGTTGMSGWGRVPGATLAGVAQQASAMPLPATATLAAVGTGGVSASAGETNSPHRCTSAHASCRSGPTSRSSESGSRPLAPGTPGRSRRASTSCPTDHPARSDRAERSRGCRRRILELDLTRRQVRIARLLEGFSGGRAIRPFQVRDLER